MLVSAQSEDNQTELRTQRAHWSLQSVLELGWPQGFTATSQLGVGWKEDAKRNFVKKYMWRSYHQPIRIMNCNLSFTFLIGRNEDNHTADAARESGMVLSTWYEIFSSQLYLAGTIIHIVQVRKLRCIGVEKLAQVHAVSSYLSWVSNQSRNVPYGPIAFIPLGSTPKFTKGRSEPLKELKNQSHWGKRNLKTLAV